MSDMRIVFAGAKGRMGQALLPGLRATEGIDVVAEIDHGDDLARAVADGDADVVVDFTTPEAAVPNARAIVAAGVQGVIGTPGFSLEDLDALDLEARNAGRGLLMGCADVV